MMRLLCLIGSLLAVAGCQDAIGLGASCAAEMADIRRSEGGPPDSRNANREGGDFLERWIYGPSDGQQGRVYTFRWGLSFESCDVSGPAPLDLVPSDDGELSL